MARDAESAQVISLASEILARHRRPLRPVDDEGQPLSNAAKRGAEDKRTMRELGIGTREAAMMQRETMAYDLDYWHMEATRWKEQARTARFLTARMFDFLRLANERHAQSVALLDAANAELERLRALTAND